jgi:c-di-GMP-binding flagellar brake protein YcgR
VPEGLSRPELLRKKAAEERRKLQDVDRLLARLESRLTEGAAGRNKGGLRPEDRRTFTRNAADLVIRYRWPGRHAPLLGRVRDLSRGGLRFSGARQLAPGMLLQASLHAPGGPGPRFDGQMYLEVVHCRRNAELWEIGTRFAPMPVDQFRGTERRRARRFEVVLDIVYRASGRENQPALAGEVRDLSRSGLRFRCRDRLAPGSLAAVVISGESGTSPETGTRMRISALVRIVRCRRVGGRYEVGAQFVG